MPRHATARSTGQARNKNAPGETNCATSDDRLASPRKSLKGRRLVEIICAFGGATREYPAENLAELESNTSQSRYNEPHRAPGEQLGEFRRAPRVQSSDRYRLLGNFNSRRDVFNSDNVYAKLPLRGAGESSREICPSEICIERERKKTRSIQLKL